MKRALYYAIRVMSLYRPVVAVTTEKGHRWYGREVRDDSPTHGCLSDLRGRFDNVEDAIAVRKQAGDLSDGYEQFRQAVRRWMKQFDRQEHEAFDRLLKGEASGPFPVAARPVARHYIASSNIEWTSGGRRSLYSRSPAEGVDEQMCGAAARAAEDINPLAGGLILIMPDRSNQT